MRLSIIFRKNINASSFNKQSKYGALINPSLRKFISVIDGFTLIELVTVIAILTIIAGIAVPAYSNTTEKVKEIVCNNKCSQIERLYESYLVIEQLDHTDVLFYEFLQENYIKVCPSEGVISYVDGKVKCNYHCKDDCSDKGNKEPVPYL